LLNFKLALLLFHLLALPRHVLLMPPVSGFAITSAAPATAAAHN
jgi:DNA-binding helix-hairpin-helix protein with protein kinase domain